MDRPGTAPPMQHVRALVAMLDEVEDAGQRLDTRMRDGLGVNTVDFAVLRWVERVDRRGGTVRVGDIAAHFGVSSGSATEIAHRLERAELLCRETHPTDARIRRIVPTAKARDRLEELVGDVRADLEALLTSVSPEEGQRLVDLLRSVRDIYEGRPDEQPG